MDGIQQIYQINCLYFVEIVSEQRGYLQNHHPTRHHHIDYIYTVQLKYIQLIIT